MKYITRCLYCSTIINLGHFEQSLLKTGSTHSYIPETRCIYRFGFVVPSKYIFERRRKAHIPSICTPFVYLTTKHGSQHAFSPLLLLLLLRRFERWTQTSNIIIYAHCYVAKMARRRNVGRCHSCIFYNILGMRNFAYTKMNEWMKKRNERKRKRRDKTRNYGSRIFAEH